MHACHQQFLVAGVLHNALAAFDGFFFVHVVVGIDFGMVFLQCVTMHQVSDNEQIRELESGMAGSVAYGIDGENAVREAIAKGK